MKRSQLAWNTGRHYTWAGQRIACEAIDEGVYILDVDRMVSGFIPDCELEAGEILSRYDAGNLKFLPPSFDQNSPECQFPGNPVPFSCFRAKLDELALAVPVLQVSKSY